MSFWSASEPTTQVRVPGMTATLRAPEKKPWPKRRRVSPVEGETTRTSFTLAETANNWSVADWARANGATAKQARRAKADRIIA